MSKSRTSALDWAPYLVGVLLLALLGWIWVKSKYESPSARHTAQAFVQLLQTQAFDQAFEMTSKTAAVGASAQAMQVIAKRHCFDVDRITDTSPYQSNGNRLRRRLNDVAVELPQINVEFMGRCMFRVTLERSPTGQWKVSRFLSHAG